MVSDEALMLEFQRGSRPAMEELFARYREPIFGFFCRRLHLRERAEDLTQETFVALMRAKARYEPRAPVRTYLYGIAMKLLLAERRKGIFEVPRPEPLTNDVKDDVIWIRQALGRLEEGDREILMLREYEQLSYAEIGELLGLPLNTVRSRLFRSRLALKGQLDPAGDLENLKCK
jgi:RNA polymerase sigma-70 factor (ECF subfamily)